MPATAFAPTDRSPLVTRELLVRFVSVVGSSIGFYLPLSVVPLFAAQTQSGGSAGLATVALLVATVACELVTPQLVARIGYRSALALGLVLLGAPTLALTFCSQTEGIVAVSVVRGAGFAICVVAGGAVTATLIPAERRGEGLALVGVVGGVPGMLALPAGVWMADVWGFGPVFAITAGATLLALVSVPGLPSRAASSSGESHHGVLAGLRSPALTRPAMVFAASTAAVGVLVTFLPLATRHQPAWVAAAALLVQPAAATAARWFAGRIGDRLGAACLLAPAVLLSAVGMALLAATGSPAVVIGGALIFGIGFGVLQNATLSLMFARAPRGAEGAVSAIWNAAYDLGMAAGALGAGVLVSTVGYAATFVLTATIMLPALLVIRREGKSTCAR
jgi:predicted MFS family arabinose efflux permease